MNRLILAIAALMLVVLGCGGPCAGTEYNVGAYYYPWYGDGNFHGGANTCIRWHLVPQQQPTLGWYNSHDPVVVSGHFLWARSAGIDFLVASYWGSSSDEAMTIKNCMLANPDIGSLKICVMFEPSITVSNAGTETAYLCDNFFSDPHYYRIGGKPVLYLYATRAFSDSDLSTFVDTIRSTARNKGIGELYLVADEVKASPSLWDRISGRAGEFDAITDYDVYGSLRILGASGNYATSSNLDSWESANDSWRTVAHNNGARFFACVSPGFNDTAVRTGNVPMSRKLGSDAAAEGSFFSAIIDKAKQSCDDSTIMVTSWNEWHEDTQIEPIPSAAATSVVDGTGTASTNGLNYPGYGSTYLDLLRSGTSDVPAPPADPSNPGAANVTETSIRWTWQDNSSTETGFNAYAAPGSGPLVATLAGATGPGVAYFDYTGLAPDTQYAFQVTATNGASQSLRTPCITAVTLPAAPQQGQNVTCDRPTGAYPGATTFTFSNPAGFGVDGAYKVSSFGCIWDTSPTHTWTGSESAWNAGALAFTPTADGAYYLHLRSLSQAGALNPACLDYGPFTVDATPPTTSADKPSGAYRTPLTVHLSASEPSTIYYTTDGTTPGTSSAVYSSGIPIPADTTLRFYAVDSLGNAEPSVHTETYKAIAAEGSIAAVKKQANGSAVRLGNKFLYWKSGTLGYIEEPDRTSAIRVYAATLPNPSMVCLTGVVKKLSAYEQRIDLDTITPSGSVSVRPLGASIDTAKPIAMAGMYLRLWGVVKQGSVTASSFVLLDGSDSSGITVSTTYSTGGPVQAGEFVSITGARGFNGLSPILYALDIVHY